MSRGDGENNKRDGDAGESSKSAWPLIRQLHGERFGNDENTLDKSRD
jgi:hypothetical protein